jgi:hypothetical protein
MGSGDRTFERVECFRTGGEPGTRFGFATGSTQFDVLSWNRSMLKNEKIAIPLSKNLNVKNQS